MEKAKCNQICDLQCKLFNLQFKAQENYHKLHCLNGRSGGTKEVQKLSLLIRLAVLESERQSASVPVHTTKAHTGRRGMADVILNLSSRWR